MAFKADYMTKFDQLDRFAKQQRSSATQGAGAGTRQRTQKMLALGQSKAEETKNLMQSSAQGVRRIFAKSDVGADRDKPSSDLDMAAWIQSIEEDKEENKPEEKKLEVEGTIARVDFDEGMIDFALGALSDVESLGSGGYSAVGPIVKKGMYKGDKAYGKYQVMGKNIGAWTEKYYGKRLTIDQFLADPQAQDTVAENKVMENWEKYGNIEDSISVWFTGKPVEKAGNVSDGFTTAPEYLKKWNSNFIRRRDEELGA